MQCYNHSIYLCESIKTKSGLLKFKTGLKYFDFGPLH